MDVGKRPDLKDTFASLEMTLENSALHCLRILVGMMSKGGVFGESRLMRQSTIYIDRVELRHGLCAPRF